MKVFWIDLFCGAGGTSTGIHLAHPNTQVIACVNHDEKAIVFFLLGFVFYMTTGSDYHLAFFLGAGCQQLLSLRTFY